MRYQAAVSLIPMATNWRTTFLYSSAVIPGLPPTMRSRANRPLVPAVEGDLNTVADRTRYRLGTGAREDRAVDGHWLPPTKPLGRART